MRPVRRWGRSANSAVIPNNSRLPWGRCVISPKWAAQNTNTRTPSRRRPNASRRPGCRGTTESRTGNSRKRPMTVAPLQQAERAGPCGPERQGDRNVRDEDRPAVLGPQGRQGEELPERGEHDEAEQRERDRPTQVLQGDDQDGELRPGRYPPWKRAVTPAATACEHRKGRQERERYCQDPNELRNRRHAPSGRVLCGGATILRGL